MPSPHAVAASAFVHAERSILGRIKHGSNERWFVAAFAATGVSGMGAEAAFSIFDPRGCPTGEPKPIP
jgi:hypothetical protein